ncbi:MAG: hypothetical protein CSA62_11685 [Planctomycetota bacterium]|nr:MAG: hypothetical protein CSA62_11685 [Planctomycetota bacterium]
MPPSQRQVTTFLALLGSLLLLPACGGEASEFEGSLLRKESGGGIGIRHNDWIALSETYYRFGKLWHGDTASKVFRVKNRAKQNIRLVGIRNACTCAGVELGIVGKDGKAVAREIHQPPVYRDGGPMITWLRPGEILTAKVLVDSTTLAPKDHKEKGDTTLVFQPQEAGTVRFAYDIDIRSRIVVAPAPAIALEPVSKYQRQLLRLELSPGEGLPPFAINKIDGIDKQVTIEKIKALQPNSHYYLVELGPFDSVGPVQKELAFHTDLASDKGEKPYVAHVKLAGFIVPTLMMTPSARLDFGRFDFDDKKSNFITVKYLRPEYDPELRLDGLVVSDPSNEDLSKHFSARLKKDLAPSWTIYLEYDGGLGQTPVRRFSGKLLLRSRDPDHKATWIPFTGFRRDRSK